MQTTQQMTGVVGVVALAAFAGCASVMSGRHADVTIKTNVPHATVVVRDKRGEEVAVGHTPTKLALKRKDKFIFPAKYTARIEAPGYEPVDVPIRSTVNPWVLGNIVFGGPIGLVVDNATGAAWKPRQTQIFRPLRPLPADDPVIATDQQPAPRVQPVSGVY
jgi:hypothetical protein